MVQSTRTQPEATDRHLQTPLRAHPNTPKNALLAAGGSIHPPFSSGSVCFRILKRPNQSKNPVRSRKNRKISFFTRPTPGQRHRCDGPTPGRTPGQRPRPRCPRAGPPRAAPREMWPDPGVPRRCPGSARPPPGLLGASLGIPHDETGRYTHQVTGDRDWRRMKPFKPAPLARTRS